MPLTLDRPAVQAGKHQRGLTGNNRHQPASIGRTDTPRRSAVNIAERVHTLWRERPIEYRVEEQVMDAPIAIIEIDVDIALKLGWGGDLDDQIVARYIDGRGTNFVGACDQARDPCSQRCLHRLEEGQRLAKRPWEDVQGIVDVYSAAKALHDAVYVGPLLCILDSP